MNKRAAEPALRQLLIEMDRRLADLCDKLDENYPAMDFPPTARCVEAGCARVRGHEGLHRSALPEFVVGSMGTPVTEEHIRFALKRLNLEPYAGDLAEHENQRILEQLR